MRGHRSATTRIVQKASGSTVDFIYGIVRGAMLFIDGEFSIKPPGLLKISGSLSKLRTSLSGTSTSSVAFSCFPNFLFQGLHRTGAIWRFVPTVLAGFYLIHQILPRKVSPIRYFGPDDWETSTGNSPEQFFFSFAVTASKRNDDRRHKIF